MTSQQHWAGTSRPSSRPGQLVFAFVLAALACGAYAQAKISPRESFQQFIDAVLDESSAPEARNANLDRCFDFDAWAAEKQKAESRKFSAEELAELKTGWATVLASAEFRDNWKRKNVRITEEGSEAVVITLTEGDGREQRISMRMRLNPAGDLWRWYWSEPLGARAADQPMPQPQTTAEMLKALAARLDAIEKAQGQLATERDELLRQRRRLEARLEEESGAGAQGTPGALANGAGKALIAADWEAFAALHAGALDAQARARFDKQAERVAGWTVKEVSVREPGKAATVSVEVAFVDKSPRVIALRVKKAGGRWFIDEEP